MTAPLLDGRAILISGVGPGLGRKLALQCAAQGARLALAARSAAFLDEVAAEVRESGGEAVTIPTDVSDPAACRALVTKGAEALGGLDAVVNSAFRFTADRFEEADLDGWRQAMAVACFGGLEIAQAALPHLKASRGCIVNVSTVGTRLGSDGSGGYNIAKAALNMATRQLAVELGGHGIRVNGALMGWMAGEPLRQSFASRAAARGVSPEKLEADLAQAIPLRRIPTDDECAGAVIFLLSDLAAAVTGALLDVNGGQYMAN
ncbi:SDR family oxidoreductase [Sphingomonas jatrophae]|uniref:NAD(P)-dependent dehydrogenase, short-chain alcohol dehydrogenase family n=1 Tax=Sphingomonas jatrophae TaxID=1166337 RepID=A0A1I6KGT1_9SPHN|nr:SDR family oxidoreductase [Sphingomonas jatrophae]SFR90248.1 NAD(P)-dependent dehydrogenase, short-chain alcohol dehydrogenase family [Sphingomonas jatrophae]